LHWPSASAHRITQAGMTEAAMVAMPVESTRSQNITMGSVRQTLRSLRRLEALRRTMTPARA
jgi:hypothetical protein